MPAGPRRPACFQLLSSGGLDGAHACAPSRRCLLIQCCPYRTGPGCIRRHTSQAFSGHVWCPSRRTSHPATRKRVWNMPLAQSAWREAPRKLREPSWEADPSWVAWARLNDPRLTPGVVFIHKRHRVGLWTNRKGPALVRSFSFTTIQLRRQPRSPLVRSCDRMARIGFCVVPRIRYLKAWDCSRRGSRRVLVPRKLSG